MITPSKSTEFKDSIIYKMTYILDVDFFRKPLIDLYEETKSKFECIDEFIYAIDVLYILGKIKLEMESGVVEKC